MAKVEGEDQAEFVEGIKKQRREKRIQERELRTNASTQTSMNIDATELTRPLLYTGDIENNDKPLLTITSTSLSQNFQVIYDQLFLTIIDSYYQRRYNSLSWTCKIR